MSSVLCPHCRVNIQVQPEQVGRVVSCPNCKGQFQVPPAPPVAAPPVQSAPLPVIHTGPRPARRSPITPITVVALSVVAVVITVPCVCAGLLVLGGGGDQDGGGGGFVNEVDQDEPRDMPGLAKWNHGHQRGLEDGSRMLKRQDGMRAWKVAYDDAGSQMRTGRLESGESDQWFIYMAGFRAGMREAKRKAGK